MGVPPPCLPPAPKLVRYADVPHWIQDNTFIHAGYRPISHSTTACLQSLSYLHNESVNIYTHLLPSLSILFLSTSLYAFFVSEYPDATLTDRLVLGLFLAGAAGCFGASALFHTLCNHSERVCGIWLRVDFVGILVLMETSFVSGVHVAFFCEREMVRGYIAMVISPLPRHPLSPALMMVVLDACGGVSCGVAEPAV